MGETRTSRPLPAAVGRYEILLPIASGGMATVYLARSRGARGFEREVALKLTHAHLNESSDFAAVLLEEGSLAARIRHGNVVSILDIGEDPLGLFLVMEYVEGDTLANLQREANHAGTQVPANIGLRILLDALAGLHAAHELRDEQGAPLLVVHRDFSPQNILVGLDGIAQLTDFGVAKAANSDANTATGVMKGKVAYMSPEQARGMKVDRRADVWAAGVVAWEILAGRKLHTNPDGVSTLLKVVTEPPPLLRTVAPHVPVEVEAVVASALQHDLDRRCPTAADFARELTHWGGLMTRIAEADEVARYVREHAGSKLAKRREQVERAAQLRAKMNALASASIASGGGAPGEASASSVSISNESVVVPTTPDGSDDTVTERQMATPYLRDAALPDRRKTVAVVLAVVVAVIVALGATTLLVRNGRDGTRGPATSGGSSGAPAAATLAQTSPTSPLPPLPSPPSPATASAAPRARDAQIFASAPIAALRVDGRRIPLPSPTATVAFRRDDGQLDRSLDVWVQASDGRQATGTLAADATVLRVQLPARAPSPAAPTPSPSPQKNDCNPPYTLDADGVRIPKRHCQ